MHVSTYMCINIHSIRHSTELILSPARRIYICINWLLSQFDSAHSHSDRSALFILTYLAACTWSSNRMLFVWPNVFLYLPMATSILLHAWCILFHFTCRRSICSLCIHCMIQRLYTHPAKLSDPSQYVIVVRTCVCVRMQVSVFQVEYLCLRTLIKSSFSHCGGVGAHVRTRRVCPSEKIYIFTPYIMSFVSA